MFQLSKSQRQKGFLPIILGKPWIGLKKNPQDLPRKRRSACIPVLSLVDLMLGKRAYA
jgi:hypothetical protein